MESEIATEQRQQQPDDVPPSETPPVRGRPFVKGQSGNPAGRPSRARMAAVVAEGLIGRKTVPLTNKLLDLALAGDLAALRLCLDRIVPRRREPPVWLDLPRIASNIDLADAVAAVVDAAARGAVTPAQAVAMTRAMMNLLAPTTIGWERSLLDRKTKQTATR